MAENKLPKPASCATDAELEAYIPQFHESGDRRVLAVEILRLRKIIHAIQNNHDLDYEVITAKPVKERREKPGKKAEEDPLI
jgi:hypothetical protein